MRSAHGRPCELRGGGVLFGVCDFPMVWGYVFSLDKPKWGYVFSLDKPKENQKGNCARVRRLAAMGICSPRSGASLNSP